MARPLRILSLFIALTLVIALASHTGTAGTLDGIRERGVLLWGSDAEGGA